MLHRAVAGGGFVTDVPERTRRLLEVLHEVLVCIRDAAGSGDMKLAFNLADAFEELPARVAREGVLDCAEFERIYFSSLLEAKPEFERLRRAWSDYARLS
jgi:hypothetical protein